MPQPSLPLGHTIEGNKLVILDGFNFERHKHIIGISGSGKSSFIASIVVFLLRQGVFFCLIDPHGDLAKLIISLLSSRNFYNNPRAYDRLCLLYLPLFCVSIWVTFLNQGYFFYLKMVKYSTQSILP